MNILIIINGAAYGQDTTYNAVRLAKSLSKRDEVTTQLFLMGDGVTVAMAGQKTPDGYYKLDRMLSTVIRQGGQIRCCGTCMDARGITDTMLTEGATRSTMDALADWTIAADKVLVF
ncbi:DsrE family protein [Cryobacterium sp. PH29-G1]|uniref:DsrE/DsrF/TusD sulfur relay family protein n=1 Tax=Cryobacterium sp. PH29-G1 TaxID=3046211 RepID=UPI0024B8DADB|nr:DsrE family protein [Cryobacterium sp. PH29-G1]MDJ0351087.1 DsrE family protein [Cryobacterium sp. PH29-G1]